MKYDWEALSTDLFDLLVAKPDGVTINEIAKKFDVPVHIARGLTRHLRKILGNDDTVNVICTPQSHREQWRYQLVGNYDEGSAWVSNRIGDVETRIETMNSVVSALARALDKRTVQGRRAMVIARGLGRVIEDLTDLREQDGVIYQ